MSTSPPRADGRPAVTHTLADLLGTYGYVIVALFLIAEGCGIPFPAETMLVTAAAWRATARCRSGDRRRGG